MGSRNCGRGEEACGGDVKGTSTDDEGVFDLLSLGLERAEDGIAEAEAGAGGGGGGGMVVTLDEIDCRALEEEWEAERSREEGMELARECVGDGARLRVDDGSLRRLPPPRVDWEGEDDREGRLEAMLDVRAEDVPRCEV